MLEENKKRTRQDPEFELHNTGIFEGNKYFDVFVEYAKADPEDILIKIEIFNRGEESAGITVISTLWLRNTWAFSNTITMPDIKLSGQMNGKIVEDIHEEKGT